MSIKTRNEMKHLNLGQYRQYVAAEKTKARNGRASSRRYPPNPDFDDRLPF